jgi:tRNA U38,U39,U40 pseudouridine synthase TruA
MEIGRGRWGPRQIDTILDTCDRRNAGPCVLPDGLTLVCVHYRPEDLEVAPNPLNLQGT